VAATAAAQTGFLQAGSTTQPKPKTRNLSAASPVAKPSPFSPSKGKSGRGSEPQRKLPSASPGRAASTAPSFSSPPSYSGTSVTRAPAPSSGPASSDSSGKRSLSVLVVASRQFEVALDRAGVTNGGIRWERATEKEKEKERMFTRMVPLARRRRARVGRRTTHGRYEPAAACNLACYLLLRISRVQAAPSHPHRSKPR
jgi:hypothetical protein